MLNLSEIVRIATSKKIVEYSCTYSFYGVFVWFNLIISVLLYLNFKYKFNDNLNKPFKEILSIEYLVFYLLIVNAVFFMAHFYILDLPVYKDLVCLP